jgi:hypothetical protein
MADFYCDVIAILAPMASSFPEVEGEVMKFGPIPTTKNP